ncbi:sulfurtransferase [Robbsia andropogonis]|uniref:sulfurtransferase n=1 Tax=Robbsia andropogonis TaxID=28092 RepID=UPI000ABA4E34|nr:sulfurtransferase [Robbsia andropogonis]
MPSSQTQALPRYTTLIDAAALSARIVADAASLLIIDCRADLLDPEAGPRVFAERHLPGAHHLNLESDLSGPKTQGSGRHPLPDRETLAATLARLGMRADTQVVAYDAQGGMYAARLWWLLRWLGHEAVAVLDGGMPRWESHGGLVEFSAPRPTVPGDFAAGTPLVSAVDTATVLRNIDSGDHLVIDARASDRYRGENETIDPVGGHIPGARNRFFKHNLDEQGQFQSPAALRSAFLSVLDGTPPDAAIMQCGSGVTACHNLLAMEVAGLPGAALYAGSWSEWIADPSRPVVTGATPR